MVIRDPILLKILRQRWEAEGGDGPLLHATYGTLATEFKSLARFLGLKQASVTLHGLRRGGATCNCSLYFSYDRTQEHGRWSHQRTARQYIDEAMAESGLGALAPDAIERIGRAARVLPSLL